MNYPITGNVSLGNLSGNIKLFINDSGSGNLTGFGYNNNCMTFSVNQSVTDTPEVFINQFGNVGIGTTTPIFPLDVIGNIRLGTGTTGNIRFGTSGVGTTQAGYIDLVNNTMTVMNQQNGNIIFGTNNGEDMRISSNGNVGIGTQTPQFPLDVIGNIRLGTGTTGNILFGTSGVGTTQAGYIDLINNNMTVMNQQNGNIIFGTNNAEDMRISSNGNVGIGTSNPHLSLDVSGGIGSKLHNLYINAQNAQNGTMALGAYPVYTSGLFGSGFALYQGSGGDTVINAASGMPIDFKINNTNYMRVASSGNVAIGHSSPITPLDVKGTLIVRNSGDSVLSALSSGNGNFLTMEAFDGANNTIKYPVCLAAYGGNVGIGTTAPQSVLEMVGTRLNGTSTNANHQWMFNILRLGTSGVQNGTSFGIRHGAFDSGIGACAKTVLAISGSPAAANQWGYIPDVSAITMQINNSGVLQVGIGTSNPTFQLQLALDSAAKPTTTTWTTSSDIRIKENITDADLDICYSICKNLRLRRFTWKDYIGYEDDKNVVGYIAQEVQEVFPKSVSTSNIVLKKRCQNGEIVEEEIQDFLSLNVDQINKTLHGAVQKLIKITEEQQTIISNLEARLSVLENK